MVDASLFVLTFLVLFTDNFKPVGVATNTFFFYKPKPITSFSITDFQCDFTTLLKENAEAKLCYLPLTEKPCTAVKIFRRKFFGFPNTRALESERDPLQFLVAPYKMYKYGSQNLPGFQLFRRGMKLLRPHGPI